MNDKRIVIVGFMGCGKTAVARELARLGDERWVDLDARIEEVHSRSPAQIIVQDGETVFREIETATLQELLSADSEHVIALGGGAWISPRNRELIREHDAVSVWLDAPFELCWRRIIAAEQDRPLAPTRELAQQLYLKRGPTYNLADFHVPVADELSLEVAKRIVLLLQQQPDT